MNQEKIKKIQKEAGKGPKIFGSHSMLKKAPAEAAQFKLFNFSNNLFCICTPANRNKWNCYFLGKIIWSSRTWTHAIALWGTTTRPPQLQTSIKLLILF